MNGADKKLIFDEGQIEEVRIVFGIASCGLKAAWRASNGNAMREVQP
jgi:hypothetical protein